MSGPRSPHTSGMWGLVIFPVAFSSVTTMPLFTIASAMMTGSAPLRLPPCLDFPAPATELNSWDTFEPQDVSSLVQPLVMVPV